MSEVKYAHQNVAFEATDLANGKFNVLNRFYFTNLKKYMISYEVKEMIRWCVVEKFHWM